MGIGDKVFAAHPDPRCHYCGCRLVRAPKGDVIGLFPPDTATRDHTHPKCDGGQDWVPCCMQCNQIKGSDPYQLFATFMVWGRDFHRHERKNEYKKFRLAILEIGLAVFDEEKKRLESETTQGS